MNNKMMFRVFNSEEQVGLRPKGAPPIVSKREENENTRSPIYRRNKTCCQVRGAFERRELRSNALPHAFDVLVCVRPQVHHSAACVRV
jgi:hypothetical protein